MSDNGQHDRSPLDPVFSFLHDDRAPVFFDRRGFASIVSFDGDSLQRQTIYLADVETGLKSARQRYDDLRRYSTPDARAMTAFLAEAELLSERANYLALFYEEKARSIRRRAEELMRVTERQRRRIVWARRMRRLKTLLPWKSSTSL